MHIFGKRFIKQGSDHNNVNIDNIDLKNLPIFNPLSEGVNNIKIVATRNSMHIEFIQNLIWSNSIAVLTNLCTSHYSQCFFTALRHYRDPITKILNKSHPLFLAAKISLLV